MMKLLLAFIIAVCSQLGLAFYSGGLATGKASSKTVVMGIAPRPSGFSTTKEGKEKIISRTKALLEGSQLVITVPFEGVKQEQIDFLRKEIPQSVVASVVKNSLMKFSLQGTDFEPLAKGLSQENLFVFIPEGEAKPTFAAIKKWQKEFKRTEKEQDVKSGAMDGQVYFGESLEAVSQLPTKIELITKIAMGIKAVPTKIGRGVNAVPNKLGRAFGALKNKLEEEAGAGAEASTA